MAQPIGIYNQPEKIPVRHYFLTGIYQYLSAGIRMER